MQGAGMLASLQEATNGAVARATLTKSEPITGIFSVRDPTVCV